MIDKNLHNKTFSSDYGATPSNALHVSAMNQSQIDPGNLRGFKSSIKFLEKLSMKEIKQKLYNRDGSLPEDNIPFFIKQMDKDRMIRTNNSHNMRAKDKVSETQKYQWNCRPIKQNYIFSRMANNRKQVEKCTARKMILFERQMEQEKIRDQDQGGIRDTAAQANVIDEQAEVRLQDNVRWRATSQQQALEEGESMFPRGNVKYVYPQRTNGGLSEDGFKVITPQVKVGVFPSAQNEINSGLPENQQIDDRVYSAQHTEGSSRAVSPAPRVQRDGDAGEDGDSPV